MKKNTLVAFLAAIPLLGFSQTPLNTFDNYFTQLDNWNNYYDSVRDVRWSQGDTSMQGTGYSGFKTWEAYWDMLCLHLATSLKPS